MQKLIVALSAVLITGLAGFSVSGGDAQEARIVRPKVERVEIEEVDEEAPAVYVLDEAEVYTQTFQGFPAFRVAGMQGQPGTWQIVSHGNVALLLNTATGDTFALEKGEEGLHWKPVPRPMPEMPMMPREPRDPREPQAPRARNFREMPDREHIEAKLEALRNELRKTKGEAREELEKAIEELEESLEGRGKGRDAQPRKDGEREDAKRAKERDNPEDQLREIEGAIKELKERYEESDSVKEREKLQRAINELKEKAESLRKERKDR